MNIIKMSELDEILKKEYARFMLLMQHQEENLDLDACQDSCCDYEDEEESSCCGTCDNTCCDEEEEDEEVDTDFDPLEYALLFSVIRITSYVQTIIQSGYMKAHQGAEDFSFEAAIEWLKKSGMVKKDDELNELALLFTFFEETMQPYGSEDLLCFTQDSERLPTLPIDQVSELVEASVRIAQRITQKV